MRSSLIVCLLAAVVAGPAPAQPTEPAVEPSVTGTPAAAPPATEPPAEPAVEITWQPSDPQQGDALLVTVRADEMRLRVGGRFIDRRMRFYRWGPGQWRALVPISVRTEPGTFEMTVVLTKGRGKSRTVRTLKRELAVADAEFPESELKVDPKFTKPPKEQWERIRTERERIKEAWRDRSDDRLWRAPMVHPLDTEKTGEFGTRRVFNDVVKSRHLGLDTDGKVGDPVKAATRGRVVLADHLYYTGRCVFLDHGFGLFTVYFHLSELLVQEGDVVEGGQLIGKVGRSGRVTGPHLHFGVKLQGSYVNPERFLALEHGEDPRAGKPTSPR